MKAQVFKIVQTNKKFNIAHCCIGNLYGTVIATKAVDVPGEYEVRSVLKEKDGRIAPEILIVKE